MMKRCKNWPAELTRFLEAKRAQPFDWKTNNCAFFACDWLVVLMGVDPAADFRGEVDSALSAARAIDVRGGLDKIASEACARWEWPQVQWQFARRGDPVEAPTDRGPKIGVCVGAMAAFAGTSGVVFEPMSTCTRAWRVG